MILCIRPMIAREAEAMTEGKKEKKRNSQQLQSIVYENKIVKSGEKKLLTPAVQEQ